MVLLISIFLPLEGVMNILSPRHLILPVFALLVAVGLGLDGLWNRGGTLRVIVIGVLLAAVVLLSAVPAHLRAEQEISIVTTSFAKTGRFLWYKTSPDDAVVNPSVPNWYFNGLAWLKTHVAHEGPMGRGVCNMCYALELGNFTHVRQWWRYDPQNREVLPISSGEIFDKVKACHAIFVDKPLRAEFWEDTKKKVIHWSFGPYREGRYFLVDTATGYPYPLPQKGSYPATFDSLSFNLSNTMVCYESRSGWKTCGIAKILNGG